MSETHRHRRPVDRRWTWLPLAGSLRCPVLRCPSAPGAVAAAVLVALLTTACGVGDGQTDSAPSSPAVAAVTEQAQTTGPQPSQVTESLPPAGTVNLPFSVALSFMDTPGLGQQVPLQISMYSTVGPSMVMVEVDELPAGVSLVQGGRHWEACLEEEESKAFELLLGFPQEGTFRLGAMVVAELAGGARYEQQHQLDIQVTKAGSTVSHHQPQTRSLPATG